MKTTIKATIGIIAIALSGMNIALAEQNSHKRGHDRDYDRGYFRNYEKPRHERHFRKHQQRQQWKRANRAQHRYDRYRAKRHFRKHHDYNHRAKRHFRAYERTQRNHSDWRRGHHYGKKHLHRGAYAPRVSVSTHLHSNNALPTIAGGLIGSAIANDASNGDAGATFGGAIFGALVGNAIARH